MKKLLLVLCLLLALTCLLVACDEGGDVTPAPDDSQNEENGETPEGEETPEDEETPAPHSHSWSAWETTKAATCTAKGEQKRTCACGESETQELALKQHTAAHREATAASCTAAGNVEYWECSACGKYFSNSDCSAVIADKSSVVLAATGHQSVSQHARVEATCTTAGNIEYWECSACGKYFSNSDCSTEITNKSSVVLAATGHQHVTHYDRVEATCTTAGNIEYWECTDCDCYFSDEDCTTKVTNIIIAATGHQHVTHHARVEVTCTEAGNVEYWECTDCDCYFLDEDCESKIADKASVIIGCRGHQSVTLHARVEATCTTDGNIEYLECDKCGDCFYGTSLTNKIEDKNSIIIPASHGNITHHEAVAAEEATAGNIEYWECTACGKYFSDATGTVEITDKNSVILPALAHAQGVITHYAAVAVDCLTDGNIEYWSCSHCDKYFSDAGCTQEIADKASVILPATGHSFAEAWTCSATQHWHAATCKHTEEKGSLAAHTYGENGCCTVCTYQQNTTVGLHYVLNEDGESYSLAGIGTASGSVRVASLYNLLPVNAVLANAFENCSVLTGITIPSSVESIGNSAFKGCSNLASMTLPFVGASLDGTGSTHFGYIFGASSYSEHSTAVPTSLKTVVITGSTSIDYVAFYNCYNLISITIPASVTSIGEVAFYGCNSLTSITLPFVGESPIAAGYQSHFGYIFGYTSSSSSISGYHYYDSSTYYKYYIPDSLTTVVITGGTSIGWYAFFNCDSLTSITIPASVTSIGHWAFEDCDSLTSITIPASVTRIGYRAFYNCDSLTSVTFGENSQCTIISESAFSSCTSLEGLTIPASVKSIGYWAFARCYSLTSVTFGENSQLTSIDDAAFYGCNSLTSITIPASVRSIGSDAFYGCSSLTSVRTPSLEAWCSITFGDIDSTPLRYAENLYIGDSTTPATEIVLPNTVWAIKNYAFYSCNSLTSITIPASVTSIGSYAFFACRPTSITIPSSVTSIGKYAFHGCTSLTSVTFENTTGWWVSTFSTATLGTSVDVSVPTNNHNLLIYTYDDYYWKRTEA